MKSGPRWTAFDVGSIVFAVAVVVYAAFEITAPSSSGPARASGLILIIMAVLLATNAVLRLRARRRARREALSPEAASSPRSKD